MQNNEILEFGICYPLSVEFIWETVRYRLNQSTYYRKLSTESFQTGMKGENSMYLSNIRYFGILAHFFLKRNSNICYGPSINHQDNCFAK